MAGIGSEIQALIISIKVNPGGDIKSFEAQRTKRTELASTIDRLKALIKEATGGDIFAGGDKLNADSFLLSGSKSSSIRLLVGGDAYLRKTIFAFWHPSLRAMMFEKHGQKFKYTFQGVFKSEAYRRARDETRSPEDEAMAKLASERRAELQRVEESRVMWVEDYNSHIIAGRYILPRFSPTFIGQAHRMYEKCEHTYLKPPRFDGRSNAYNTDMHIRACTFDDVTEFIKEVYKIDPFDPNITASTMVHLPIDHPRIWKTSEPKEVKIELRGEELVFRYEGYSISSNPQVKTQVEAWWQGRIVGKPQLAFRELFVPRDDGRPEWPGQIPFTYEDYHKEYRRYRQPMKERKTTFSFSS